MTREQLYDVAHKVYGIKDPAVLIVGERCVLGEWVSLATFDGECVVRSKERGIRVIVATSMMSKDPWGSIATALAMTRKAT